MTIEAGARLGPYEITAPIGAGGMGEVYRAKDTRLGRDVAVKVLPAAMSSSPELRQRLDREAKTISQLSHPHICTLHDVGHQDGTDYLVMELLDGETLADRLGRGTIPLEQALRIGIEIAGALDAAHRQGIVHRDLKPGNIMLTKSGVKLLDFGLAKLAIPPSHVSQATSLPTALQESQPLTSRGTILGTFQYMSPEQLEGREADARSDIFAFGCVLYEMLTGQKAFTGKSQASLIGSIMTSEPAPISSIQPMTPPAVDRLVKGCLAKEPEHRWSTAHDVMLQLQWIAEGGSAAGLPAPVAARRKSREKLAWGVAAALFLAAAALTYGFIRRAPKPPRLVRFEVAIPPNVTAIDAPKISPDGKTLAFNATDAAGKTQIWLRPLNALTAQPLPGTEGTRRPFWSPDSRFLAFMADGKLKKIDVTGGPPTKICDAPTGVDGSWSPEGVILLDGTGPDPILRVSAAGGAPVVAVKAEPSRKEIQVGWPEFLPDGRHFLYMAMNQKADDSAYRIGSLDSAETRAFAPAQTMLAFAPPGYLLFAKDRTLMAQRFDAKALKMIGEPVPLAEQIGTDTVGLARFSVSRDGVLAYRTGESGDRMVWVDRAGKELDTVLEKGEFQDPSLSPAGDQLAFELIDARTGKSDVWLRDLARGVDSRFTFAPGNAYAGLWTPDGDALVYTSERDDAPGIYEKSTVGRGEEKLLARLEGLFFPTSMTPDGSAVAVQIRAPNPKTGWDILILPRTPGAKPVPFRPTPFNEGNAHFSPDGKFIAFMSNESGRNEVYVQAYPGPGRTWQISTSGGADIHWSADGKELFYRAPDQRLMAVETQLGGGAFQPGIPRPLFLARIATGASTTKYAPDRTGQRFLVVSTLGREYLTPTTIVLNWSAGLGK
jgi:Tol biopolymer transport system component/tRNA A-37 threonylcarbamoyl transferase component Bud32